MTERTDYIKVRVSLPFDPNKGMLFNEENSTAKFHPEFIDALQDEDAAFREPIITFLNDEIGNQNWAVHFTQLDEHKTVYDVRLYSNDPNNYERIAAIIKERIPNIKFNFTPAGTIDDYLNK